MRFDSHQISEITLQTSLQIDNSSSAILSSSRRPDRSLPSEMYSLQMLTKLYVSPSETIRSHRRRDCSSSVIANYGGAIPISDRRWRVDGKRISILRFSADLISGGAGSSSSRTEAAGAGASGFNILAFGSETESWMPALTVSR